MIRNIFENVLIESVSDFIFIIYYPSVRRRREGRSTISDKHNYIATYYREREKLNTTGKIVEKEMTELSPTN